MPSHSLLRILEGDLRVYSAMRRYAQRQLDQHIVFHCDLNIDRINRALARYFTLWC